MPKNGNHSKTSKKPNHHKKVLIVEDEKPMARAMELKLTNSGFGAKIAFNGQEAMDVLGGEKFDIILLDLVMPKMDGFTMLSLLKNSGDKTPVIVLTNLSQPEDMNRAKEMGAADYFVKSDTPIAKLVDCVKAVLNGVKTG